MNNFKIGFAKDIHKLFKNKNRTLILGGISFDSKYKIKAHSDGDIIFHAIADAILSSLNLNDIGFYFSDQKVENKNLSSLDIIKFCLIKLNQLNFSINQIDLTIVCNKIYLFDKKEKIINNLKSIFCIPNINIKGTRFEKHNNTIECYCLVSLLKI